MKTNLTCTSFDDPTESMQDTLLDKLNEEKKKMEKFNLRYGSNAGALKERSYQARDLFQKLFKTPVNFTRTHWKDGQLVITYGAPFEINADSLEAEVIAQYYKDARIQGDLITIPYYSL